VKQFLKISSEVRGGVVYTINRTSFAIGFAYTAAKKERLGNKILESGKSQVGVVVSRSAKAGTASCQDKPVVKISSGIRVEGRVDTEQDEDRGHNVEFIVSEV